MEEEKEALEIERNKGKERGENGKDRTKGEWYELLKDDMKTVGIKDEGKLSKLYLEKDLKNTILKHYNRECYAYYPNRNIFSTINARVTSADY